MKTLIVTFFMLYSIIHCTGQEMKFEYHEIGNFGRLMGQTAIVDVNKDGY